jgi:hypothetical protein
MDNEGVRTARKASISFIHEKFYLTGQARSLGYS